jgi:hypothetical protein
VPEDQVEEELPARLGGGRIVEFIQNHDFESGEVVGNTVLSGGPSLGFEPLDEIEKVVDTGASAN